MVPSQVSLTGSKLARVEQRLGDHAAADGGERQAVLGGDAIDILRGLHRAGARHVLHHHGRIAGDVLADVTAEQARIEVVAAAGGEADQDGDGLAAIEVLRGLRARGRGERQGDGD